MFFRASCFFFSRAAYNKFSAWKGRSFKIFIIRVIFNVKEWCSEEIRIIIISQNAYIINHKNYNFYHYTYFPKKNQIQFWPRPSKPRTLQISTYTKISDLARFSPRCALFRPPLGRGRSGKVSGKLCVLRGKTRAIIRRKIDRIAHTLRNYTTLKWLFSSGCHMSRVPDCGFWRDSSFQSFWWTYANYRRVLRIVLRFGLRT